MSETTNKTIQMSFGVDEVGNKVEVVDAFARESVAALSEELADKTGNYITPEDFGAKGNWADDSAAVQACLDYAKEKLLPVRGFGRYSIGTTPIVIDGRNQDVYLHALTYTGTEYAVKVQCAYSNIVIDSINAPNGGGINIVHGGAQLPLYNTLQNSSITSNLCCIHVGHTDGQTKNAIGYTSFNTSRLASSQENCIRLVNLGGGENKFNGNAGALDAPNDYAFWLDVAGTVSVNNYSIEDGCKSGFYVNETVVKAAHVRTRECMDKKRIDSGNVGMMLTLVGYATFTSPDTYIDYVCIDASGALDPYEKKRDVNASGYMSQVPADRYCNANYYGTENPIYSFDVPGVIRVIGTHKFIDYEGRQIYKNIESDLDLREWGILPPTTIDVSANATCILNDAYCSYGINSVIVDQTHGYKIVIKDHANNVVFDGAALGEGKYTLHCVTTGVKDADASWIYDNEYDTWVVDRVPEADGLFETIETITLDTETQSVMRTAEPDGRAYAFGSVIVHLNVPAVAGISTSNCVAYCGDGADNYYGKIAINGAIQASGGSVWGGIFDFCGALIGIAGTGQSWTPSAATVANNIPKRAKTLRRIDIGPASGNFPAGTVITIMATRKMA